MAKTKKKRHAARHRASWKGNFSFGLVTFPVQAWNAINREGSDIHFHQLHAGCHKRIRYQKVCPVHGEISNDEIVSGYEFKKNRYVEVDPEELDALRTDRERALTIDAFIGHDAVDPLYFDGRMYYLLPDGSAAEESYAVVVEAMEREERFGIGQMVFSGKEQLALVRPLEGLLQMAMLNYDEEIRQPASMRRSAKTPRGLARKVRLAQTMIRNWSEKDFDFTEYDDPYRQRVEDLIVAKVAGRELTPPDEEEQPQVVNLMDALKKSLAQGPAASGRKSRPRKKRRSA